MLNKLICGLIQKPRRTMCVRQCPTEHNTSVHKYWKILFYPSNTDTGTFYGGSTDIDTVACVQQETGNCPK